MWCAVPSSGLIMDRPGAGYAYAGSLLSLYAGEKIRFPFPDPHDADRRAARRLYGDAGPPQPLQQRGGNVRGHRMQKASAMPPSWLRESFALRWCSSIHWALPPEKRYSGAPLSSRTASISQSAKGPARPVPAALRKASFAAKSAAALAAMGAEEEFPSESPSASRSAGPKTLAAKVEPWGAAEAFAIQAVSQRSQPMPYIMICLFSAKQLR